MLKVFVQRSKDRLFLKAEGVWTALKEEARNFVSCTCAINYCVEQKLTEVRLWLSFDDAKYDFPMEVFRAETRMLVQFNRELRVRRQAMLAVLDQEQAQTKERKKQFRFHSPIEQEN
jgi:hypothetical protein